MGANFMIALPMTSSKEQAAVEMSEDQLWKYAKDKFHKKRCIYVEDQIGNQDVLKPLLKYLGFTTICTANGEEVLSYLELNGTQACTLLITDLRMPKMSGQTLIMEIRKLERRKKSYKIPIIVLTGEPSENEKNICINLLGVEEYLSKPASFNRLTEAIQKILAPGYLSSKRKKTGEQRIAKGILIIDDDQFSSFLTKQFLSGGNNTIVHQAFTLETVFINIYI